MGEEASAGELRTCTAATVAGDGTWRVGSGAVVAADLLMGEYRDARLEPHGWDRPGFGGAAWPTPATPSKVLGEGLDVAGEPVGSAVDDVDAGGLPGGVAAFLAG
ncbi:hypothetical protein HDA32_002246 [Spinactinospora alkalitolerans]|uniref:Bacterial alpha-L-rhamnosidase N-terminal domain-containing protein n=1 Tax=Spinactinospora alkalitolerans TaxID=687207 RepID=A0A852TRV7_9ACTN|nr:alpha-L-rhamnosidase N-terminal domain-containing protein [Spinactinospora alkalitolerans]NYE47126.1 hypothetical protein [Spinactinospora alkalitolerans]